MDQPERGCEHLRLLLPITRPVDPGVGGTALKFLGRWLKMGGNRRAEEGQEAQRPANWRAGRGGRLGARTVCSGAGSWEGPGIVIELAEVRTPLNEVKKERGNDSLGTMQPK